jgi:hypothetical protein
VLTHCNAIISINSFIHLHLLLVNSFWFNKKIKSMLSYFTKIKGKEITISPW